MFFKAVLNYFWDCSLYSVHIFAGNETEISYFKMEDYRTYQADSHLVWWTTITSLTVFYLNSTLSFHMLVLVTAHYLLCVVCKLTRHTINVYNSLITLTKFLHSENDLQHSCARRNPWTCFVSSLQTCSLPICWLPVSWNAIWFDYVFVKILWIS